MVARVVQVVWAGVELGGLGSWVGWGGLVWGQVGWAGWVGELAPLTEMSLDSIGHLFFL